MSLMFCVCVSDSCGGFLYAPIQYSMRGSYEILMGLDE